VNHSNRQDSDHINSQQSTALYSKQRHKSTKVELIPTAALMSDIN